MEEGIKVFSFFLFQLLMLFVWLRLLKFVRSKDLKQIKQIKFFIYIYYLVAGVTLVSLIFDGESNNFPYYIIYAIIMLVFAFRLNRVLNEEIKKVLEKWFNM